MIKRVRLIEDDYPLVKPHRRSSVSSNNDGGTLYQYMSGITRRGDDNWVWQGYAVAENYREAHKTLVNHIRIKFAGHSHNYFTAHIGVEHRFKTTHPKGVYEIEELDY